MTAEGTVWLFRSFLFYAAKIIIIIFAAQFKVMHDFLDLFLDVLRNSILITGLVIIMMLMIEYVNIHSHGKWFTRLHQNRFGQVVLGAG